MKRQKIASLTYVDDKKTFVPEFEPTETYNLKEFLNGFYNALFRSGVWNEYKVVSMQEAIARCNRSSWGADIYIEWDEAWELGEYDSTLNVYFSCPCNSDMW